MLKIMIVDDEVLPRIALRNIVENQYLVVGEAPNSATAMEVALRTLPDIILVDIIMPDVDGLEFIHQVSQLLPMTRFVVVSNAENVDYLKRAVRLNVFDYLVKGTITQDSLLEVLERLSRTIIKERSVMPFFGNQIEATINAEELLNEMVENVLSGENICESRIRQIFDTLCIHITEQAYFCITFEFDLTKETINLRRVITLVREIVADCGESVLVQNQNGLLVCFFSTLDAENGEQATFDLTYRCMQTVKNTFGTELTAGISSEFAGFSKMHEAYQEALTACRRSFYTGRFSVNRFAQLTNEEKSEHENYLKSIVLPKLSQVGLEVFQELPALLSELKQCAEKNIYVSRELVISLYMEVLYHAAGILRYECGLELDDVGEAIAELNACKTLNSLHDQSMNILLKFSNLKKEQTQEDPIIAQIKKYVEENIAERLSLEDVAKQVYLTPTYVSQYFKNKTGEKLRSYIVNEKIRHAKIYLLKGKGIHETAIMTGFISDSYFIQCFKTATNMTPGEYLRKNRTK